jgi:regulator of sirC expression with transglutaminase-like and TPR domain
MAAGSPGNIAAPRMGPGTGILATRIHWADANGAMNSMVAANKAGEVRIRMLFYRTVQELRELLTGTSESHPLDLASLQLATIECGLSGVDIPRALAVLDGYAGELLETVGPETPGTQFLNALNELLFVELGYRGNETDYYNIRNSCLNHVLADRTGIPITLSVVYMEVARRAGRQLLGIGLPGHVVVGYDDGSFSTYVDVFRGGGFLSREQCRDLVLSLSSIDIFKQPQYLRPATKRQILIRMLSNMRVVYVEKGDFEKAIEVLGYMILAVPNAAEEHKQRAVLRLRCHQIRGAAEDLEKYLALTGNPPDRAEIVEQLEAIHRRRAALN